MQKIMRYCRTWPKRSRVCP